SQRNRAVPAPSVGMQDVIAQDRSHDDHHQGNRNTQLPSHDHLVAERLPGDFPLAYSLGGLRLVLRVLGYSHFFLSAIDPCHATHNSPPRRYAMFAVKKDIA